MQSLLAHLTAIDPASVYFTLAGMLLLCGFGLPIPEDISLICAGYMAHRGIVNRIEKTEEPDVVLMLTPHILRQPQITEEDLRAFPVGRDSGVPAFETPIPPRQEQEPARSAPPKPPGETFS